VGSLPSDFAWWQGPRLVAKAGFRRWRRHRVSEGGPDGKLTGIDLLPLDGITGVTLIQGDLDSPDAQVTGRCPTLTKINVSSFTKGLC